MAVKEKILKDYKCEKLPNRPADGRISMAYYIRGARMYKQFIAAQREDCAMGAEVAIQEAREHDCKRAHVWNPNKEY